MNLNPERYVRIDGSEGHYHASIREHPLLAGDGPTRLEALEQLRSRLEREMDSICDSYHRELLLQDLEMIQRVRDPLNEGLSHPSGSPHGWTIVTREVTLRCPYGLSLLLAQRIARLAARYQSHGYLRYRNRTVSCDDLLHLISLCIEPNCQVIVRCDGPDAERQCEAICTLLSSDRETHIS